MIYAQLTAFIAQAEAEGIDVDAIREDIAKKQELTDEEYRAAVRAEIAEQRGMRAVSYEADRATDSEQGRETAGRGRGARSSQADRPESAQRDEPEGLTSPTREDILSQQDRAENAQALDDKAQIDREASGFTLQSQTQDNRKDNTGDMFGGPSVEDYQAAAQRKPAGTESTGPDLFSEAAETNTNEQKTNSNPRKPTRA